MLAGVLSCGFARRAGYRNYLEVHLPTVLKRKITEGFYSVVNLEHTTAGEFAVFDFFADHGTDSAFG